MRKFTLLMAIGIFLMLGSAANATLLSIGNTGTAGTIPSGTAINDILDKIYGVSDPRNGFYGSTVYLTAPAYLDFIYLGYEAGYSNDFNYAGGDVFNNKTTAIGNAFSVLATAGTFPWLVPFSFDVNSNAASVANGSNPDDSLGTSNINFFVSFDDDALASSGMSLVLFLDDGGASNDDNHDDMAVRIVARAVPEPATMLLLGSGLIGLAGFGRKKLFKKA